MGRESEKDAWLRYALKFSTPIVEVKLYLSALHGADLKCRLAVVAQKNLEMLVAALIWSNTTLEKNASTNAHKTAAMQEGEC